jgi:RNA polymerase sigma-70 factor (ECF subfamily)
VADPEAELMVRYTRGDPTAFVELFRRTAPRLFAFFKRSFTDNHAVEELVQQTFLKLHTSRERYDPRRPLRPWLLSIAANQRLDELRRRYRLPPTASEEEIDHAELLAAPVEPRLRRELSLDERVQAAVAALPESQRVVIQLHQFEQLTFEEIAEILQTSPGAVRVRASRGYAGLRELLAPLQGET